MRRCFVALILLGLLSGGLCEEVSKPFYRCEIVPQAKHEVSLQIDGKEKCRWNFGEEYPRPFFFPFSGPSGVSLTRMGHPGAANHDHHRSVWFAHNKVNGQNFWADGTKTRIRQKMWLAYEESDDEAIMASLLGWYNEDQDEIMEQEFAVALRGDTSGGTLLEFQIELRPPKNVPSVSLDKTNFGVLSVRVARSISHHFGGGDLRNSEGGIGEKEIFGKAARWMDYSGPIAIGAGPNRESVTEGITFFDHPGNPRHPVKWHVRSDGWMGASLCMDQGIEILQEKPLVLRYLLHGHGGDYDPGRADGVFADFSERPGFIIQKSERAHRHFEVLREK